MRRLFRILIRSLAILSLLLCVGMCILWVRSHSTLDLLRVRSTDRHLYISTCRGNVHVGTWLRKHHDPPMLVSGYERHPVSGYDPIWKGYQQRGHPYFLGFHYVGDNRYIASYRVFVAPIWFLLASAAVLPVAAVANAAARRRRVRIGHCPACGYDLRATPDRCPECGAVPSAKATA